MGNKTSFPRSSYILFVPQHNSKLAVSKPPSTGWHLVCLYKNTITCNKDSKLCSAILSENHALLYCIVKKKLWREKMCDETPLLKKLAEKTLAIEIIFTKVFYPAPKFLLYGMVRYVRISVKDISKLV